MMTFTALFLTILAQTPVSPNVQHRDAIRQPAPKSIPLLCPRRPLGFTALATGLNRVQLCATAACPNGVWINREEKEVAGYAQSDWLWIGTSPANFSIAQQNGLITTARNRALAARPPGKTLIAASFFTDIAVSTGSGGYFVGARASYGTCQHRPPPM